MIEFHSSSKREQVEVRSERIMFIVPLPAYRRIINRTERNRFALY